MRHLHLALYTAMLVISCESNKSQQLELLREVSFLKAKENGILANEGFSRCQRYMEAWLSHADSASGLIPRNIRESSDYWNAKDAAADNYPFMVLTAFFTDQEKLSGTMTDMLEAERKLTNRVNSLPDTYSFSKSDFLEKDIKMGEIIFGSSEYIKDGLLPLAELLGRSPWFERMEEMIYDLNKEVVIADDIDEPGFGNAPKEEVNGELLQALSRMYWATGDEKLLDWAISIGDYYLLGNHHPTRDLEYLRLRDHGCELISGLCELYVTTHFAKPQKKAEYQPALYTMLDRILVVGRNSDGFFYDGINPQTGEVIHSRIADNWGYTLNGFYSVFMIDNKPEYKQPILELFSNLNKYRNHDWEGNADGYADAIESALNLYNRISDPTVAEWIDSEIKVMWAMQQEDGIIEGWHGDGNFARTTIMYNLWKSRGVYAKPWSEDLYLGAEQKGDSLFISIRSDAGWKGKLHFDKKRFSENLNLPLDYPRINQFQEWFTVQKDSMYTIMELTGHEEKVISGNQMINGIALEITGERRYLVF